MLSLTTAPIAYFTCQHCGNSGLMECAYKLVMCYVLHDSYLHSRHFPWSKCEDIVMLWNI